MSEFAFKIFIGLTSGGIHSSGNRAILSVRGANKQKRRRSCNGELPSSGGRNGNDVTKDVSDQDRLLVVDDDVDGGYGGGGVVIGVVVKSESKSRRAKIVSKHFYGKKDRHKLSSVVVGQKNRPLWRDDENEIVTEL